MNIFLLVSFFLTFPQIVLAQDRFVADLHNHMFGHEAWDGGWFHGEPTGPESEALAPCSGNESFMGDHGIVLHPWLSKIVFKSQDTGRHEKQGHPKYVAWPRWDTLSHQQMWEGHLKQAWQSGLRFMIVSFYNNEPICKLMWNKARYQDCSDMAAVDRQFDAYEKFLKGHDENDSSKAPRSTWVVHASSSEEAKQAIKAGKLVLIPSIEVSDLFPKSRGDWQVQLQKYYDRGLRTLQLVHQFNNRFGGSALHEPILKIGQIIVNQSFFDEKNGFNQLGLTAEGKELIQEMMARKMLIDVAHLSEAGIKDFLEISTKTGTYYPFYNSHTHTRVMMSGVRANYEKSTPDEIFELHRAAGGIIGLRTGSDSTHAFADGKMVANDCQGTSKSFSQSYLHIDQKLKTSVALGSDFNGFITQMKPRFHQDTDCMNAQAQPLKRAFDHTGYGHIGQMGDIFQELENFGVDLTNLNQSALKVVEMWQMTENPALRNPIK
jgi:microsomal dipeptidase-like Zn-dependent dipeptidase